jgi:type I restriction enzyme R subunit
VRAALRVAVKRLLRKYGYPPTYEKTAVDTVIEQAERMAGEM